MDFEIGESRSLYKQTIDRFIGSFDNFARSAQRSEQAGFSRRRWTELAELGLLDLPISEAEGGIGGDAGDCAVVAQALGHGVAPDPWLECGFWPAFLLQGRAISEGVTSGERLCAVAWSEPGWEAYGSLPATVATPRGQKFRLTGEKQFVLGGAGADMFIVLADHAGAPSCFLIPRDREGVSVRTYRLIDGSNAALVILRDVEATDDELVAAGARISESVTGVMLLAAAELVGLAQRLFDETLAYVKAREQFGQAIGRFQVIQHRMVDHYVELEKARSTLLWAIDEGWGGRPEAIAGAKAFIAQLSRAIGHDAVQLHGGMGITDELLVGHALKRVVLLSRLVSDPATGLEQYERIAFA